MRSSSLVLSAAVTISGILGIGAASAADMAVKALPPAPPVCIWCGFYVGANLGGAWGRDSVNTVNSFPVPPFIAIDNTGVSSTASPAINASGFTGGLQAGYNWQTGNWVWGLEGDFNYLGLKGSQSVTTPFPSTLPGGPAFPPTTFFSVATSVSTNWLFTARPRLGWAWNNWLFYGTGGVAVGDERISQVITFLPPFVGNNTFSTTRVGWTAGAGVEFAINRQWSVKAEYLYVDLGRTGTNGGVLTPAFAGYFNQTSMHLTTNIVRVGANWHF